MRLSLYAAPASEPMICDGKEPQCPRQSGIYQILCRPTGKIYVGSSVWLAKRKRHHREGLLSGTHHNSYLQKAWNKYGIDAFEYSVLEYCKKENLTVREQHYIDLFRAADSKYGFNLQPKAYSNLGMVYGPEVRARMSAAKKGSPGTLSPLQIEELRERMKGNSFRLGIKHTLETCNKMKEKRRGKKPALGMKHTDEYKKAMSERVKGIPLSKEHSEKISKALKGKKQTTEHRFNLALVQSKIKPDHFENIRAEYIPGLVTMKDLANRYGCCAQTICNIINGNRME